MQNRTRFTEDVADAWGAFEVSPDGQWLAYDTDPNPTTGTTTSRRLSLANGSVKTLTTTAISHIRGFAPDSSFAFYISEFSNIGFGNYELWIQPQGDVPSFKMAEDAYGTQVVVTPDSNTIVYGVKTGPSTSDLYLGNPRTGGSTLVDTGVALAKLSRTGSHVAYFKSTNRDQLTGELWLAELPGGQKRQLATQAHLEMTYSFGFHQFSPNDDRILFLENFVAQTSATLRMANTSTGATTTLASVIVTDSNDLLVKASDDLNQYLHWTSFDGAQRRGAADIRSTAGSSVIHMGDAVGYSSFYDVTFPNLYVLDDFVPEGLGGRGTLKFLKAGEDFPRTVASNVGQFQTRSPQGAVASYMTNYNRTDDVGTIHLFDGAAATSTLLSSGARSGLRYSLDNRHAAFWDDYVGSTESCALVVASLPNATWRHELTRGPLCYMHQFVPGWDRMVLMTNGNASTGRGDVVFAHLDGSNPTTLSTNVRLVGGTSTQDQMLRALRTSTAVDPFATESTVTVVHADTGAHVEAVPAGVTFAQWVPGTHRLVYAVTSGSNVGVWALDIDF